MLGLEPRSAVSLPAVLSLWFPGRIFLSVWKVLASVLSTSDSCTPKLAADVTTSSPQDCAGCQDQGCVQIHALQDTQPLTTGQLPLHLLPMSEDGTANALPLGLQAQSSGDWQGGSARRGGACEL